MIFGLGQGLHFVYINLSAYPRISGRIKPFEFVTNLMKKLNIDIKMSQPKNSEVAFEKIKKSILKNEPVLIYVDMPYLKYLKLEKNNHFGGHSVIVFGFDDDKKVFYVSDRDSKTHSIKSQKGMVGKDFHLVPYEEIKNARASKYRPFPANNKWVKFDFSKIKQLNKSLIKKAIHNNSKDYLNQPAHLLGLNGIKKFSNEVKKWKNFSSQKLKIACINNYFMINKAGGTGGGAFRKMYGNFLIESYLYLKNKNYKQIGEEYINVSKKWDKIGDIFWSISKNLNTEKLETISQLAFEIYKEEEKLQKRLINNKY
jgi:hypothetical protein